MKLESNNDFANWATKAGYMPRSDLWKAWQAGVAARRRFCVEAVEAQWPHLKGMVARKIEEYERRQGERDDV